MVAASVFLQRDRKMLKVRRYTPSGRRKRRRVRPADALNHLDEIYILTKMKCVHASLPISSALNSMVL